MFGAAMLHTDPYPGMLLECMFSDTLRLLRDAGLTGN